VVGSRDIYALTKTQQVKGIFMTVRTDYLDLLGKANRPMVACFDITIGEMMVGIIREATLEEVRMMMQMLERREEIILMERTDAMIATKIAEGAHAACDVCGDEEDQAGESDCDSFDRVMNMSDNELAS
jgi:hypothetical protein